ncbi:kinase-like domain-containing protein [Pyronema omphalodes]|nr:kinase-like domain-containing protein [Pyronema omphalodes]
MAPYASMFDEFVDIPAAAVTPVPDASQPRDLTSLRSLALNTSPPPPPGAWSENLKSSPIGKGGWSHVVPGLITKGKVPIAIKKPAFQTDAKDVLLQEAKVLGYIKLAGGCEKAGVVEFLGYDPVAGCILMPHLMGMSLKDYTLYRKKNGTKAGDNEPVVGLRDWLKISSQLADTFGYLKKIGVIHGDVSWNNVVISSSTMKTVVIDFTSGVIDAPDAVPSKVAGAVTTAFVAPELLEAHFDDNGGLLKDDEDKPSPTYASDMYGLGMTLLAVAIGQEAYQDAGVYQGVYARQGIPLEYAKNGENGGVVRAKTPVARALEGCFGNTADKRCGVEEFGKRIAEMMEELKFKK